MWSTPTLAKLNAEKKPTKEELARSQMQAFLEEYGLQITLKTLVEALEKLIEKRDKDHLNLLILESLRGIYRGYMRRHERSHDES
jgi:hypothetical protein